MIENKQLSPNNVRALGGILIFIGLFLMSLMGGIMVWMNNIIVNSGKYSATTKWNGTPEQAQMGFLIMGMVALFGLAAAVAGTWQLLTGKRSKSLIFIMLGLWVVLMISAWAIRMFF